MSDNKDPKVTECYVNVDEDGSPCVTFMDIYTIPNKDSQRAALIIFREDYDALVKELKRLEELQRIRDHLIDVIRGKLGVDAVIAAMEAYDQGN